MRTQTFLNFGINRPKTFLIFGIKRLKHSSFSFCRQRRCCGASGSAGKIASACRVQKPKSGWTDREDDQEEVQIWEKAPLGSSPADAAERRGTGDRLENPHLTPDPRTRSPTGPAFQIRYRQGKLSTTAEITRQTEFLFLHAFLTHCGWRPPPRRGAPGTPRGRPAAAL